MKQKVAFILLSGFRRLHPHFGSLYRWFQLSEQKILPKPIIMECASAGFAGVCCAPWTDENFCEVINMAVNLKPRDIKKLPASTKAEMAAIASSFLLQALPLRSLSRKSEILLRLIGLGVAAGGAYVAIKRFLNQPCIYDNLPLRQFLKEKLNYNGIRNSEILIEILATDRRTGELEFFNNRTDDPDFLVSTIIASTRLIGLPPEQINGRTFTDAIVGGDLPIDRAIHHGCDAIVVFQYTPDAEVVEQVPTSWLRDSQYESRRTHIVSRNNALRCYETERKLDPSLPPIYIIRTKNPLLDIDINHFTSEQLHDGVNVGCVSIDENLDSLLKFLS